MSYFMSLISQKFHIAKVHLPKVKEELQAYVTAGYPWVGYPGENASLFELFGACGWDIQVGDTGDIDSIDFFGTKLSGEGFLFKALAPYVTPGSCIRMQGEGKDVWDWNFLPDGTMQEVNL